MTTGDQVSDTSLQLPADVISIARARAFVDDAVRRWGVRPHEALPLLTSEVVTNAVVHTDAEWVEVRVRRQGARARVEVLDHDPRQPVVEPRDLSAPGGFGMWLVEELARSWGVTPINDGKVVWFELELEPGSAEPAP